MKELSREEVQRVETKLLEEFADICESHGLSYYLAYGTLIGAARHQGFIPWDDDVDVMMPRKDFEILFSEFNGWRLRDTSQFVHCRNETCRFPFARIMDTRTLVDEEYSEGEEELGAWIDIFPLDDMPLDADKLFKRIGYWNTARMLAASDPKKELPLLRVWRRRSSFPAIAARGQFTMPRRWTALFWIGTTATDQATRRSLALPSERSRCQKHGSNQLFCRLETENTAFQPAMTRCSLLAMETGERFHQKKSVSPTR